MATARDDFDSRHLDVLRAVIDAGSITKAARQLHLSQPAVTASVKKLEGALGVTLLERFARGVRPTDAGRRLLLHARRIDAQLDELVADVTTRDAPLAPLVLGASTTIAAGLVPKLFARFRAQEGATGLRLVVGNTSEIIAQVESGALPLGLVEGPPRAARVRLERLLDDTLLPVVAANSPFRGHNVDLNTPVLWREVGSGTRTVVERALRKLGRKPMPFDLELGSTAAIRRAVGLSLGVAFLSRWSMGEDLDAGRLRLLHIPGLEIGRRFSWALPSAPLSGTAARFHAFASAEHEVVVP